MILLVACYVAFTIYDVYSSLLSQRKLSRSHVYSNSSSEQPPAARPFSARSKAADLSAASSLNFPTTGGRLGSGGSAVLPRYSRSPALGARGSLCSRSSSSVVDTSGTYPPKRTTAATLSTMDSSSSLRSAAIDTSVSAWSWPSVRPATIKVHPVMGAEGEEEEASTRGGYPTAPQIARGGAEAQLGHSQYLARDMPAHSSELNSHDQGAGGRPGLVAEGIRELGGGSSRRAEAWPAPHERNPRLGSRGPGPLGEGRELGGGGSRHPAEAWPAPREPPPRGQGAGSGRPGGPLGEGCREADDEWMGSGGGSSSEEDDHVAMASEIAVELRKARQNKESSSATTAEDARRVLME